MEIRDAKPDDAAALAAIYNPYVTDSCITFEIDPVSTEEMRSRVAEAADAKLPWLVATDGEDVVGYAYASKWKGRCAYRFAAESTVYLDPSSHGKGLGRRIYSALIARLKERGIRTAIAGIALPNDASVALHERLGFEKVAHFKKVGFKQQRWIDVGYWQLLIEDQSFPCQETKSVDR